MVKLDKWYSTITTLLLQINKYCSPITWSADGLGQKFTVHSKQSLIYKIHMSSTTSGHIMMISQITMSFFDSFQSCVLSSFTHKQSHKQLTIRIYITTISTLAWPDCSTLVFYIYPLHIYYINYTFTFIWLHHSLK